MQITSIFADEYFRRMPVRWTAVQNLHLTLQFLGDTEEKRIPDLRQILNRVRGTETLESIQFTDGGAFPNFSQPRILWLAIKKSETLIRVHDTITEDLTQNGFEPDRKPFKAHLTLGRVRDSSPLSVLQTKAIMDRCAQVQIDDSPMTEVVLFESILRPGGPVYTKVYGKRLF